MEFEKVVKERHSVRDFSEKDVSNDLLTKIVKVAQRTPSWTNSQPWKVYIAKGKALQQIKRSHLQKSQEGLPSNTEIKQISSTKWGKLPTENTQTFSNNLTKFLGDDAEKMGKSQIELYNAPALVYLVAEKDVSPWMIYDIGAFSQTLMLAAKNEGVDSIPAYEIVRFPEDIHSALNIPDTEIIVAGIALGYPTDDTLNDFYTDRDNTEDILKIEE